MKKLLPHLLFALLVVGCGENLIEEVKERYGEYGDGVLKVIEYYKKVGDNQELVRKREYYENGQIWWEVNYKGEGSKEVIVERITYGSRGDTLYWEKPLEDFYYGKVREEITERYDDDKKKTIMKFVGEGSEEVMVEKVSYSQSGDTLILEKPLEKMKMVRKYSKNGQRIYEKNSKYDKLDGKSTFYWKNGQIFWEGNYKDGELDGKYTDYYENGQIKSEMNWKDGKEDGKSTYYYENGNIQREENYVDGWRRGKWTTYNEDGSIKEIK